jgi:hypothetical protein
VAVLVGRIFFAGALDDDDGSLDAVTDRIITTTQFLGPSYPVAGSRRRTLARANSMCGCAVFPWSARSTEP